MLVKEPSTLMVLILFAALSFTITMISVVGYYAITPIQANINKLQFEIEANTRASEKVQKDAADARSALTVTLNDRVDHYRADLNSRIAEINRMIEEIKRMLEMPVECRGAHRK